MRASSDKAVYKKRVKRLIAGLEKEKLDSFATLNLKNIRYLTGFSGTSAGVVISGEKAHFLTDFRYESQAKRQVAMKTVITFSMHNEIASILKGAKARSTGFEGKNLSVAEFESLKKKAKGRWKPTAIMDEMRLIKDEAEIRLIEKNLKILAKVFRQIPQILKAGKKERDVAAELEFALKLAGGDGKAFDFIVASGKRSALPHGVAGAKKIGKNDFITLDWGCLLEGYHTDNTRSLCTGKPSGRMKEVFDIVLEANRRAIKKVKPGIPLKEIDAAARGYINQKGYAKFFGHGTGHGVGLDIHEAPVVAPRSKMTAKEGMLFTIEPGIYIPELGGVRIEDMVLVTKTGCRLLTRNIPQELVIL